MDHREGFLLPADRCLQTFGCSGCATRNPTNMPSKYALQHGYVYQDDEDFLNLNFWIGSPDTVMGGGSNTWRALAKVK